MTGFEIPKGAPQLKSLRAVLAHLNTLVGHQEHDRFAPRFEIAQATAPYWRVDVRRATYSRRDGDGEQVEQVFAGSRRDVLIYLHGAVRAARLMNPLCC